MPAVLVLCGIDWDRLETAPADGEGEGVSSLQHFGEPAVALHTQLHVSPPLLNCREASHQDRLLGIKVLHQLTWNTCTGYSALQEIDGLKKEGWDGCSRQHCDFHLTMPLNLYFQACRKEPGERCILIACKMSQHDSEDDEEP